jgi:diguanylate cyclase (GGDEF)-like protein/PAS domain S-box-containing protein
VRALHLLDTLPEVEFDQVAQLAAEICSTPVSLISLVDENRQWFKAVVGLGVRETPRNVSFCSHAIQQDELFLVEDAAQDARFQDNGLVTGDPHIRFYAGVPLHAPDGGKVGTLCVIDTVPRQLTAGQRSALNILALQVQTRFELRAKQRALELALAEKAELAAKLEDSNNLFLAFMTNGPFASFMKDSEGRYVFYNAEVQRRFGIDEHAWIGHTDLELFGSEVAAQYREHDLAAIAGGVPVEGHESSVAQDGSVTQWKAFKFPFHRASGEVMLAALSVDVTADLEREKALAETLKTNVELLQRLENTGTLFHTFMDFIPMHAFLKSEDGRYLFYNRQFADQLGIDQAAWIGKTDYDVLPRELAEHFEKSDMKALRSTTPVELYDELPNAAGKIRKLHGMKFSYLNAQGERTLAGIVIDMTDLLTYKEKLEVANERLEQLATTDTLTGLRNRRIFEERAEVEFQMARRKKRPLAMLVLDIDNFKKRNDLFGHAMGDLALKQLGAILQSAGRIGDLPARIGGEEFAFLLPETTGEEALNVAERIHQKLREIAEGRFPLTVSIGVASMHVATAGWRRLLACADDAMYVAKTSGKNRTVLHHDHIAQLLQENRDKAGAAQERQVQEKMVQPIDEIAILPHLAGKRTNKRQLPVSA